MTTTEVSKTPTGGRPRRVIVAASLVTGGFVLGIASLAAAAPEGMPWHGGFHHHHGPKIGMIQHVVHRALDNVGATSAQEDKIHDIIAATYTQMQADKPDREAMRQQLFDILKAPTIDRAAIEKLRAQKVAEFDTKSKAIADALEQAASQLSPEQRTKLVQNVQDRMEHKGWEHGGWGGGHHGDKMDRGDRSGPNDGHEGGDHD